MFASLVNHTCAHQHKGDISLLLISIYLIGKGGSLNFLILKCRKCSTLPVRSSSHLETSKSCQYFVRKLLSAKVCRAMGGGEV